VHKLFIKQKKYFWLVTVVAIVILATFFVWQEKDSRKLRVSILDVGQGDAIFVQFPSGEKWLIDGGPDNKVIASLDKLLPFGDRSLTGIVLTHPHADHVTGLIDVVRRFEVGSIVMTPTVHTSPEYDIWLNEVRNRKIRVISATKPWRWEGEIQGTKWSWEFIYPLEQILKSTKDLNDTSVVSRLSFGKHSFLFVGDISSKVEQLLVDEKWNLQSTVLKVAHHGGDTSTGENFLSVVQPKIVAISLGINNKFGHPAKAVLDRINKFGAQILRTDLNGNIYFISDGENLSVELEK